MHSTITSIGPPPDRYADRIVGDMLREIARQRAKNIDNILELFSNANDGSPAAQKKLASRIEQAGALRVQLKPGKRGKYRIYFYDLTGWDIGRNKEVFTNTP